MCGLEKVSHKNVIDSTISLFFSSYSFACIIIFCNFAERF